MNLKNALWIMRCVQVWSYVAYPVQTIRFRRSLGFWPEPVWPTRLNDKLHWRKIFDRNPQFTECSDKLAAKEFVRRIDPQINIAEVLWVGERACDIPDHLLTGDVVVKTNHGSSWNILVRGDVANRQAFNRKIDTWMVRRYGRKHWEWGYFGVKPRLYVEEMLKENGLPIANVFRFDSATSTITACYTVQPVPGSNQIIDGVLDVDGNSYAGFYESGVYADVVAPPEYNQMLKTALALSREFDYVRCDLYLVSGEIYFSELTFYPDGGLDWDSIDSLMDLTAETWDLRKSWFMTTPQKGWRRLYAQALRLALDGAIAAKPDRRPRGYTIPGKSCGQS